MTAGLALFWSVRCTFNGYSGIKWSFCRISTSDQRKLTFGFLIFCAPNRLLAILVLQIIAATMTIPLLTASCIMLGVYNFVWNPDEYGWFFIHKKVCTCEVECMNEWMDRPCCPYWFRGFRLLLCALFHRVFIWYMYLCTACNAVS